MGLSLWLKMFPKVNFLFKILFLLHLLLVSVSKNSKSSSSFKILNSKNQIPDTDFKSVIQKTEFWTRFSNPLSKKPNSGHRFRILCPKSSIGCPENQILGSGKV